MDDFAEDGFARKGLCGDDWPDGNGSDGIGSGDAFKEFQGKDLDTVIEEACVYFNAGRERLEIEIVQDARSGLFGLIGARKAKIRARRAHLRDTVKRVLGELHAKRDPRSSRGGRGDAAERARGAGQGHEQALSAKQGKTRRNAAEKNAFDKNASGTRNRTRDAENQSARPSRPAQPAQQTQSSQSAHAFREPGCERQAGTPSDRFGESIRTGKRQKDGEKRASDGQESSKQAKSRKAVKSQAPAGSIHAPEGGGAGPADRAPLWDDALGERLAEQAAAWASRLLEKLAGHPCAFEHHVEGHPGQVDIRLVPAGPDTANGLPEDIARDADVMGAVEHLASRLLSRGTRLAVKVVIDTGLERERHDDRLRQTALELAKRALAFDRPQTTGPLSSQERRIVHVALKDMAGIRTKSVGKGGYLRRVLVVPTRQAFAGHAAGTRDLAKNPDTSPDAGIEVPASDDRTGAATACGPKGSDGQAACQENAPLAPLTGDASAGRDAAAEPDMTAARDDCGNAGGNAGGAASEAGEAGENGESGTAASRMAERA